MPLHAENCPILHGNPCNCGALAPKAPPSVAPVPYVCPACATATPEGKATHDRNHHFGQIMPPNVEPDLVGILADYFTGPDLALCSLAMAAQEDTTARRRAERFFRARDAFGIPREVDLPKQAADCIIAALSKFIVD